MTTTDDRERNRTIARRIAGAVSERTLDAIDDLVTDDYVEHHTAFPGDHRGPATLKRFVEPFLEAFPDFALIEDDIIAEGDRVVYHHHAVGTHEGTFRGIPPTGERIHVDGMAVYRIEDGRASEKWAVVDNLGLLRQLGVAPEPPAPSAADS